jgi:hypothetical protein
MQAAKGAAYRLARGPRADARFLHSAMRLAALVETRNTHVVIHPHRLGFGVVVHGFESYFAAVTGLYPGTTFTTPDGQQCLVVTTIVTDPQYLTHPFITSTHFKKLPDRSGWSPSPCEANQGIESSGFGAGNFRCA